MRITPAHAGKSEFDWQPNAEAADHPRPCGEKRPPIVASGVQIGSPPPMRGKGCSFSACSSVSRITPAHAGKSAKILIYVILYKDHPRPCGEKYMDTQRYQGHVRIAPAHAGKSQIFFM